MLAAAPVDVVVVGPAVAAAVEAVHFDVADQAVVGRTSDVAQAVKLVADEAECAEAVVAFGVDSLSVHADPLLAAVGRSEVAPLAVVMTSLAAPYLDV